MKPQPSRTADQIPRKKRKWDQPSDSLISSGLLSIPTPALSTPPLLQLQVAAVVHKLNQPKIQEDLVIAREIVINDADPAMRYKLTKRQTQEEIQKCTGAVVITRGKYRPPNAIPDGERPLYLHISSGTHIKETTERVLVVDHAAAMVDDMMKQVTQPLSTCVYLGFDADPSLNIAARIRGPNDQYINHIINETGATVVLRGHRSGYLSNAECEEGQPPLHLLLSSNNQKSLEDARLLAENLLDTISRECGASRISSSKLYGAVPPPYQLSVGLQSSELELHPSYSTSGRLSCLDATAAPGISNSLAVNSVVTAAFSFGQGTETIGLLPSTCSQANKLLYSQPFSSTSASYNAYAGIYPQATPLERALQQSSTVASSVAHATSATDTVCLSSSNAEKRPPQKRKFQEAPTTSILAARSQQGPALECTSLKTGQPVASFHGSMASRSMPPSAPLPPKFFSPTHSLTSRSMPPPKATLSSLSTSGVTKDTISNMPNLISVPDTLVKLMEYRDDDDEDEDELDAHENEHASIKAQS